MITKIDLKLIQTINEERKRGTVLVFVKHKIGDSSMSFSNSNLEKFSNLAERKLI